MLKNKVFGRCVRPAAVSGSLRGLAAVFVGRGFMSERIYLASNSPRRLEILTALGFEAVRVRSEIDEMPYDGETAVDYVRRMAVEKNTAARALCAEGVLLTADTAVAVDSCILGKPVSDDDAAAMLRRLSGRTHQVLTAVAVSRQGRTAAAVQVSDVSFRPLSEAEIAAYVRSGEPSDKAGAYGIQGLGGIFVRHLSGSFTGVMGLPVAETAALLADLGVAVPALR